LATPEELSGAIAVVIDVLRAATTLVHALAAGAIVVSPCQEVEEARTVAANFGPQRAILGGERNGQRIAGFDLGNSPSEYTPERLAGRSLVFTTTNGTRAMDRCRLARRVLIGAFVNATAVYGQLAGEKQVHLVCSGSRGQVSRDDLLMAGLLVERLQRQGGLDYQLNAEAITAQEEWVTSFSLPCVLGADPLTAEMLAHQLRQSAAGRNLMALGLESDILAASQMDRFSLVPELDPRTFRIRAA